MDKASRVIIYDYRPPPNRTCQMKPLIRFFTYLLAVSLCVSVVFFSYPHILISFRRVYLHTGNLENATNDFNRPISTSPPPPQTTTSTTRNTTLAAPLATSEPKKSSDNKYLLYTGRDPPDVTVVTAYFNLGTFKKGGAGNFNTDLYMRWSKVYQYIRNPFVVFTDSKDIAEKFRNLRTGLENTTRVILIERKSIWAFDWVDRIREIYSTPGYPKHYPNTVVPEYSCAQHAKYAVVEDAIKSNFFNTTYFTWIDIGYFRDIVGRGKEFVIVKPQNFNESAVAMNKVFTVKMDTRVEDIFKRNKVWIGGGMFFGNSLTLPVFIQDYRIAVERYLNMSLSSTDQQVIYAMNTESERTVLKQRVPIQRYIPTKGYNIWFYLGYSCYRELS